MNYKEMTLSQIANLIYKDWKNIAYSARPYLSVMRNLSSIDENFGCESGKSIVRYFLSNAGTWKGEVARNVKKHLKSLLK